VSRSAVVGTVFADVPELLHAAGAPGAAAEAVRSDRCPFRVQFAQVRWQRVRRMGFLDGWNAVQIRSGASAGRAAGSVRSREEAHSVARSSPVLSVALSRTLAWLLLVRDVFLSFFPFLSGSVCIVLRHWLANHWRDLDEPLLASVMSFIEQRISPTLSQSSQTLLQIIDRQVHTHIHIAREKKRE
jgi:hypothetical protein